jgi:SAM-dependent methyltransferase
MTDATGRFSDRVEAYLRYRPGYPAELVPELLARCGLDAKAVVADIGSGTGIFSARLLQQGLHVYAVEPNAAMRAAAQQRLHDNPRFHSVAASAEASTLTSASLHLLTAAQAFHWFDNNAALGEFRRVLRPDGQLALIWNRRNTSQPFQQVYDNLLREFAPQYGKVNHMNLQAGDLARCFVAGAMQQMRFDNRQRLDFAGLLGRLKSASYCPREDSPLYIPLVNELLAQFERHARHGHIDFDYDTEVYFGPMRR